MLFLELADLTRATGPDGALTELAPRDAALLAWLALEGPTPRARLATLLWPDSDGDAARNALRQRLFKLKRQCGEVVAGSPRLALAPGVRHDLDDSSGVLGSLRFEPGEFDGWLGAQRERRRGQRRLGLELQAQALENAGEPERALPLAEALLQHDPLSEAAHRRLMRLHYLRGDRARALLAFDRCERVLKHEVGAAPGSDTLALLASVERAGVATRGPAPPATPASVLRPPRLVGRDTERAHLRHAGAAGQVVALIGEAGLGKTRLLQTHASQHPGLLLAAGRPGDAGVPYATLARLLRSLVQRLPQALAAAPHGELAQVMPEFAAGPVPAGHAPGAHRRPGLQHSVAALLRAAGPGLAGVLLDDMHFADEASLDLLQSLVGGEADGEAPLSWVFALRPAEAGSRLQSLLDGLSDAARLLPLPLAPLNLDELALLVDDLGLPGVQGHALAGALLQRTGGNPMFVLETLKQALVDGTLPPGDTGLALPRPVTVGRLIERRLAQLSPGALALARVAAMAGVDFSVALAESVLGVPALQFADALAELESAQVLRGTQFAHDLVFEAAVASVPGAIARHTHARVAAWLQGQGGSAARVARHWVLAGETAQAVPALLRAAGDAAGALRPKEQCRFLMEAADGQQALGDTDGAFETLHACVEAQLDVARPETLHAVCDRLVALARTPAQQARAMQQRGWLHMNRGELPAAQAEGERFLQAAQASGDTALTADAHQLVGLALAMQGDTVEASLAHLQAALPWVQANAGARKRSEFHGTLAVALGSLSRLAPAQQQHELALAAAQECGYTAQQVIVRSNLALTLRAGGRLDAAHEQLQHAERLRLQHDQLDGAVHSLAAAMALVALERGEYREALARSEQALAVLGSQGRAWLPLVQARRALCFLALGQPSRARQALDPCGDMAGSPAFVQATRWWCEAQLAARLGQNPDTLLARAAALASAHGRHELRAAIRIDQATRMDATAGLALLHDLIASTALHGLHGSELAAQVQAARLAVALGQPQAAAQHAERAMALRRTHAPILAYAPALWLALAEVWAALGDLACAATLLQGCAAALRDSAATQVPPEFVHSFLQRNPVNRLVLARAAHPANGG